ncbi:Hypothetical protein DEACI_3134 [Acididesulfobacillus acetoxydans]|uniref:Uncharacterized protein n=1 Tax=Acididesulfobacillus acetoxydans TaxID=1561005 RepID=A0A8S0X6E6_9FIRM|nr:hypothetical protein [Acididesulfobacillus acetoxydans]CAA7602460.1 Hypothetical protein DEACI_3134 [Acididesulfobacillus acetoxydans]CEJ05915.1 Hypothetical protein DEACI_0335 [Acididesulfobacillus acetoxydans]
MGVLDLAKNIPPRGKSPVKVYNAARLFELKRRYNELLAREIKGEQWLDDPKRTDEEAQRWMPEFQKILAEINAILNELGVHGTTLDERMEGFKLDEHF